MTLRSLRGLFVLALGGAAAMLVGAACDDTSTPESPGQKVPPQGPFVTDGGSGEGGEAGPCKPGAPATGLLTLSQGVHSGKHAAITIDDRGLPVAVQARVIAQDNTVLELFRWDSTCGRFGTPTMVDAIGSQTPNGRQIAIAVDKSTGAIGVAYHAIIGPIAGTHHEELRYAQLKKNASTVEAPQRVEDPSGGGVDHIVDTPGVAMANGIVYVGYREPRRLCATSNDCDGVVFRSRDATGAWGSESNLSDPTGSGTSMFGGARDASVQVVVDSDGKPGVAWIAFTNVAPIKGSVVFIRPTDLTPTPSAVMQGADNVLTDTPDVALAFDGKKPRVATVFHAAADFATSGQTEWFIASDDGVTWPTPPLALPHDMNSSLDGYVSLSIGPNSKVAIVSASNTDDGTSKFGQPKILTAPDLSTFTVGGVPKATFSMVANWATGIYGMDGKLNVVMQGPDQAADPSQVGLLYFHE